MEKWNSKILLILAVAGGAIGIGNFCRFPTLFATWGGWFLVPYFVSFFLLGLPLMLVEWTLGCMARDTDSHSLPTFLEKYFRNKNFKYLGFMAVACCLIIAGYYIIIESWMLGYSIISTGLFQKIPKDGLDVFFGNYITLEAGLDLKIIAIAAVIISVYLNFYFVIKGISKGVSTLIKYSMPLLLIMSLIMVIKVLLTPNILEGIKFMFRGDMHNLLNYQMWLDAAGQMFFSLSVGFSCTMVYVSFSKNEINIFKDGMTSAFMNMGIEVLLASFMTIPISYIIFGDRIKEVIANSTIAFGMISMPAVFQNNIWCFIWFFLLFVAALTSSVSMVQVFISFLSDKFGISKLISGFISIVPFMFVLVSAFYISKGIDIFDFWTNTVLMPIGALFLIFLCHCLGKNFVKTFNENSKRPINAFLQIIIKYVTPIYLIIATFPPMIKNLGEMFKQEGFLSQDWNVWLVRAIIIVIFALTIFAIGKKNIKNKKTGE